MKNSLNIGLTIILLAILGCSCPKLTDLAKKSENAPPPAETPYPPTAPNTPSIPSTASSDLTLDTYNQIQTNMARSDVEKLLGGPGIKVSTSKGGGVTFEGRQWKDKDYNSIIITFRNDKVMTKTQVGLK
jgi:hypothetical protein